MIPVSSAFFVVAMICIVGISFWNGRRIEAHLRKRHPLLVNEIFGPPPPIGPADEETRSSDATFRMYSFIWSGRAKGLRDSELDRLLTINRVLMWSFGACAAFFFAQMYFAPG